MSSRYVGIRFPLWILSGLLIAGCAQKERAGDITLATTKNTEIISRGNERSQVSADTPVVGGSNLNTAFTGSVTTAGSANTQNVTTRPEGGIRLPDGTRPVATPIPVTAAVSTSAVSGQELSADKNVKAADGSSSTIIAESKIPARSITIVRTKPDCTGADCPTIKVKRINFIGRDRFNNFLDQIMASMAEIDSSNTSAFKTIGEFAAYFWKISKPKYEVVLEASVKRGDENLVVVQLDSYIFTGGAHGLSATQYINWLPQTDKILSLESMLIPKKMPEFEKVLKNQHAIWLKTNPLALENPAAYNKLWPFIPTDNAALLSQGLAVTYDPYTIAPYSFGRPTLIIPYQELAGILRPELLGNN